jgi:GR25 family glycosyltransferase involved in LPS biosynthesis
MKQKHTKLFYLLGCIALLLLIFGFVWYKKQEGLTTKTTTTTTTFKPKKKPQYLNGIDMIYWINLDRSPDRRFQMESMFENNVFKGIPNQRISAFDGKKDPKLVFSKLNILSSKKQTNIEYACLLSHLETIKTFHESENKVALIFEDDVNLEFKKYWNKTVKQIMENAPSDWEIILLSYIYKDTTNKFYNWDKTNDDYDDATNYYSGISYLINKNGSSKIMKTYNNGIYTLAKDTVHVADSHIYEITNSYAYKYPMFIYATVNNSTIHADHIPYHVQSKELILKNYSTFTEGTKD